VGWGSLQDRFERTTLGRVLISAFLIVTLVTILTANLPASRLQDLLLRADHPYLYGVALDQNWGVFSPDPRRETIDISARVTFADGSHVTWHVPRRNAVIGEYSDYRWLKWPEYVVQPAYETLWRPAALYVARKYATSTHRPIRVELMNRWYELQPPGRAKTQPLISHRTFYTTQVTEQDLRGKS
jgi:hypothetical protein